VATKVTKRLEAVAGFLFIAPNLLGFIVFIAYPLIASLLISFTDWSLLTPPVGAGLRNYADLRIDTHFWISLRNTVVFTFTSVPLRIIIALFLAVLLNQKIRAIGFFRTVYFLPVVCSMVSIAMMWQWLLEYNTGLINYMLSWAGIERIRWLSSTQWAMASVVMVAVWSSTGYNMVIFLAALQGVPRELLEAARIDGANNWKTFWHVTFPCISPATYFVTVTSIIGSFQVFDVTTVLTAGGPGLATNTLVMLIYQNAFQNFRMGYASAIAYVLFGFIFVLTVQQNILSKKWMHY